MEVTSAYSKQMMPGIIQGRVRIKAEINSDLNGFERTQIHFDSLFYEFHVRTILIDFLRTIYIVLLAE